MLAGHLADSQATASTPWRGRPAASSRGRIAGDGVVGRVGDDDRGLGHRSHHALSHPGLAQLADLALHQRIAFGLLELLLHLAERHLLALEPLPVLEQVVGSGDQEHDRNHHGQQFERQRTGQQQRAEDVGGNEALEPMALRPQQRHHDRTDHRELDQPLGEVGERLAGKQPLQSGQRRNFRKLRLQRIGRPNQPMLDHVAGERGEHQDRKRQRDRGQHFSTSPRTRQCGRPRCAGARSMPAPASPGRTAAAPDRAAGSLAYRNWRRFPTGDAGAPDATASGCAAWRTAAGR